MHLYIFSASRYIALTAMSNFVQVVQKWLETNKFVRTTTYTGSKFSQISLGLLCTRGTVVVHLYLPGNLPGAVAPGSGQESSIQ